MCNDSASSSCLYVLFFISVFSGVDFQSAINNLYHRTSEITSKRLIVRRGDTFTIKLSLTQPFKPEDQQLVITAKTGQSLYVSIICLEQFFLQKVKCPLNNQ
uniref:Transglutaminase N-terminal domain-containing protein n=1 Tax=Stegastes partitus TaxID=144197 RepID=A0A3B4ZH02_9TELE